MGLKIASVLRISTLTIVYHSLFTTRALLTLKPPTEFSYALVVFHYLISNLLHKAKNEKAGWIITYGKTYISRGLFLFFSPSYPVQRKPYLAISSYFLTDQEYTITNKLPAYFSSVYSASFVIIVDDAYDCYHQSFCDLSPSVKLLVLFDFYSDTKYVVFLDT